MSGAASAADPPSAADLGGVLEAIAAATATAQPTSPHPPVGAVVAHQGQVYARGCLTRVDHTRADPAEAAALRALVSPVSGATLYTTLEPLQADPVDLLRAGIGRVVVGLLHPDPARAGQGVARLTAAGLEVRIGVAQAECARLVEAYAHAARHGEPFVLLKVATSLDGRIATRTGHSQWITSEVARAEARRLRSTLPAILAGVGTVLADDPLLTARLPGRPEPLRVVLDSRLRTPVHSALVRTARAHPTLAFTTRAAAPRARRALEQQGVEVQAVRATRRGQVDVGAVLEALHVRGIFGVLVEGGPTVHGAFLDARRVHKVSWFMAPVLLGGDRVACVGRGIACLDEALRLERVEVQTFGPDWLMTGHVADATPAGPRGGGPTRSRRGPPR